MHRVSKEIYIIYYLSKSFSENYADIIEKPIPTLYRLYITLANITVVFQEQRLLESCNDKTPVTHPFKSSDICRKDFIEKISLKIIKFCYTKKYRYRLDFDTYFLILLIFLESVKVVFINILPILMMLAELATLGHLKIKVF